MEKRIFVPRSNAYLYKDYLFAICFKINYSDYYLSSNINSQILKFLIIKILEIKL
jgi:hypothetical protein